MSWQRFQTFPSLHVPYPYTLIELQTEEKKNNHFLENHSETASNAQSEGFRKGLTSAFHLVRTCFLPRAWYSPILTQ